MQAIYVPKGAAREYAPLACNLYRGCAHGCRYCYAPDVLRKTRTVFATDLGPRPGIIEALTQDAAKLAPGAGPVLLSFTSDPYQPAERDAVVTREALEILGEAGVAVRILTKAPWFALHDADLFSAYDVELGVTLAWASDTKRLTWEPHAECVFDREQALASAHSDGIRTWVSMEPVIDPAEALRVIDRNAANVDRWSVGKLNHDPAREREIDWRRFLADVLGRLAAHRARYTIKDGLWAFADDEIKAGFPKTNVEDA